MTLKPIPTLSDAEMRALFNDAVYAAQQAVDAHIQSDWTARGLHPEEDGGLNCGFAWVTLPLIAPSNGARRVQQPIAKWCAKEAKKPLGSTVFGYSPYGSRLDYGGGGWQFWNPGRYGGQAYQVKYAGAVAFASVLKRAGFVAHPSYRLD